MNTIKCLKHEDGRKTRDNVEIEVIARRFFKNLFSTSGVSDMEHILLRVERCISNDANIMLTGKYIEDEVYAVVKGMGPTKVPGVDGFPTLSFKRCWHIVGSDINSYCLGVLNEEVIGRGAQILKVILKEYKSCLVQCVNFKKSTAFNSSNTSEEDRVLISCLLGVRYLNDPERYLGLPNMMGRRKKASFQTLKDRLKRRINGWSRRFLLQGGKEVFIKSVLQAISTYSMYYFLSPKNLCGELDSIMARFGSKKGM
ncbi:hypothetical protein J1N35_001554 [Gossypium stocksii]|uniref:Reverse transcriptase n=1 Tax=Gossypium stocksii TaxID=47602 RepID=A0A9D3WKQ9_9ROSI|nr:hypothetical protein J1N35_001554 [Gossypium stocksii]